MSLANTTAVILAGGLGTRLRSVVSDRPKVLAEVCGRPFLEYLLAQLGRDGVKSVVLCVGYMGDQVAREFGTRYQDMKLTYSQELCLLGTGGALRLALPKIHSEQVLVLNGDSYCDTRLDDFAAWHGAQGGPATILLVRADDTRRFGRVEVDNEGRILEFREKAATSGPGWINGGIYLLRRNMIESISADLAISLEKEIFPTWIDRGLYGYCSKATLWDIGVPEAYAKARNDFATHLRT